MDLLSGAWAAVRSWLLAWPAVVWAALGGSALTLLGVFLQNVFENKRLKQRLEHDAQQRANELDQNLKRDIFSEIVEAAAQAAQALGHVAGAPLGETEKALQDVRFGPFWKGHLVGGMETIKALQAITEAYSNGLTDLLEARVEVEAATTEHDSATTRTDQLSKSRDQLLSSGGQRNKPGKHLRWFHPAQGFVEGVR